MRVLHDSWYRTRNLIYRIYVNQRCKLTNTIEIRIDEKGTYIFKHNTVLLICDKVPVYHENYAQFLDKFIPLSQLLKSC